MNSRGGYGNLKYKKFKYSFVTFFLKIIFPPPPFLNCINKNTKLFIKNRIFQKNAKILDIGSGISKGPGNWLWKNNVTDKSIIILRMDIVDAVNVDIVCDATSMPKDLVNFSSVILQSVPEHVADIKMLISESKRILKPGGYIYIEMPFLQGVHGDPFDYWRLTPEGLKLLVFPYFVISSGVSGGPIGSLIWLISDLLSNLSKSKYFNLIIRFSLRWLLSPLRIIDFAIVNSKASSKIGCEYFILAQKPEL